MKEMWFPIFVCAPFVLFFVVMTFERLWMWKQRRGVLDRLVRNVGLRMRPFESEVSLRKRYAERLKL